MKNEIHTLKELGDSLANIRDSKDLSQKDLSEQTGLDQKVISLLENGNPDIPLQSLINVLDALDMNIVLENETTHIFECMSSINAEEQNNDASELYDVSAMIYELSQRN